MTETTNPRMDELRRRIDQLETLRRMPWPTPEIGHIVLFLRNGDPSVPIPGCVVGHGGPGQLDLKLFVKNSQAQENVNGIFWHKHPFHVDNPQVLKIKGGGVWVYREGDGPTEQHKKLHDQEIARQIASLQEALRNERAEQIRRDSLDAPAPPAKPKTEKATAST